MYANPPQSCLNAVRRLYPKLSLTERKIADYLLLQPQKVIHISINQLAEELQVADSTVFRFCVRIGFKGFQSMKIALAAELASNPEESPEGKEKDAQPVSAATKVFRSNMQALEDTLSLLNEDLLPQAAECIAGASVTYIFGNGDARAVALDAYGKLIRTGKNVQAVTDPQLQLMTASQLTERDCVVLISHSGSSKGMLRLLNLAKSAGTPTIAITGYPKSPLGSGARFSFCTASEATEFRTEAMASLIAQLSLVDALYETVMLKRGNEGAHALARIQETLER